MKTLTLLIALFSLTAFGQSFRISQFTKTTNVTDEALFILAVTNTTPATNYSVRYQNLKQGITNGLVTTNMLYAATNTLFEYTTNAIAASGSGDGTVSNLNTLTADLPLIGNGAGQIKSISVASNYSILNLTNFVELEQVKWRATRQRKPWIGFDTFYSSWNGSNTAAGMVLGSGTNIYCGPSDEFCSVMMTNMIESGLHARGLTLISINDGWQCAKGGRVGGVITVNSNLFPNGMPAFVDKAHRLGYKVRLYNDITPSGSCCGLEPFTNIVVDAQTLKDWKIDALTIDTCGAGGSGGSDDAKRDLHLNFISALKSVGWNGSYEVHFNVGQTTQQYTNYYAQWPLMQNTFQHTREWGDLYGGLTNWWGEALDHIDTIQHVMGGLRPGHHPQMGYLDGMSQDGFIAGVQWSTIYHFGWMNYFMQAMHQSDLIISVDYTAHPFVNNRRFQTNDYLYRIQQDNYYDPPTKIVTNGDCEIWSKHLDDGSVAFSIINRAISVSSLGNHFATTPQSIDLNLRGFGVRSNEVSYMVDCINFTNRLVTDLTTFTCATNTFQQWIWYPERNFTIPRGNLIIGGTNQTGPGMVKLMDASASGGATILRSDSTGVSFYDGNNVSRVGATGRNLVATEQVLISDGSVRITNSGIAVLNVGHAGIDNTNHLSIDTVAGNNSLVVSTNGKTYGTFVGDGSGLTGGAFPLTADANFGGFSGTNVGSLYATNRIGIGTVAPTAKLDVVSDSNDTVVATFQRLSSGTNQSLIDIRSQQTMTASGTNFGRGAIRFHDSTSIYGPTELGFYEFGFGLFCPTLLELWVERGVSIRGLNETYPASLYIRGSATGLGDDRNELWLRGNGMIGTQGERIRFARGSGGWNEPETNLFDLVTFLTNGLSGFGTTNPTAKLEIAGTTASTLFAVNTNQFVVTNANVGIGTATPGKKLDVVGTGRISTVANVGSQVAGTGLIVGNQTAGLTSFGSDIGLDIYAAAASVVAGFNYINQSTSASAGLAQQFILHNSGGTGKRAGVIQIVKGGAWSSAPTEDSTLLVRLLHDGVDTERFVILSSGNVGIDTTSPQAKLDVAGDIRASTTITATNGFASYATNRVAISATGYTNTLTVSSLPVNVDVYFSGATAALSDQNGNLIHTYVVAVTGSAYAKMKPNWRLVGTTMVGNAVAD